MYIVTYKSYKQRTNEGYRYDDTYEVLNVFERWDEVYAYFLKFYNEKASDNVTMHVTMSKNDNECNVSLSDYIDYNEYTMYEDVQITRIRHRESTMYEDIMNVWNG